MYLHFDLGANDILEYVDVYIYIYIYIYISIHANIYTLEQIENNREYSSTYFLKSIIFLMAGREMMTCETSQPSHDTFRVLGKYGPPSNDSSARHGSPYKC